MNRNDLKSLVKECLLEILIEGVGNESPRVNESRQARPVNQAPPMRRPALDMIRPRGPAPQAAPPRPKPNPSAYKEIVGGNDVMANIFAETAASGLVESLGSGASQNSNPVIDTGVDPNLFEGASNWAALAFSDSTSKRSRM